MKIKITELYVWPSSQITGGVYFTYTAVSTASRTYEKACIDMFDLVYNRTDDAFEFVTSWSIR
jgi:hypothetical protein